VALPFPLQEVQSNYNYQHAQQEQNEEYSESTLIQGFLTQAYQACIHRENNAARYRRQSTQPDGIRRRNSRLLVYAFPYKIMMPPS
jgi:hypothetical protein